MTANLNYPNPLEFIKMPSSLECVDQNIHSWDFWSQFWSLEQKHQRYNVSGLALIYVHNSIPAFENDDVSVSAHSCFSLLFALFLTLYYFFFLSFLSLELKEGIKKSPFIKHRECGAMGKAVPLLFHPVLCLFLVLFLLERWKKEKGTGPCFAFSLLLIDFMGNHVFSITGGILNWKKKKEEWLDDNNVSIEGGNQHRWEGRDIFCESFGMLCRLLHTAATVWGGNVRGEPWKCGVWSITGRASSWAARDGVGAGIEHINGNLVGKFSGVFQKHDVWGLGEASASMGTHLQTQLEWDGILVLWSKED